MSKRLRMPRVGARRCGFVTPVEEMTPNDRREVERFKQYLSVAQARKDGADPGACDMLEAAIYPEGIGRTEPRGDA